MHRTLLSPEAMEADKNHASAYVLHDGRIEEIPMLRGLEAIAPAASVQSTMNDLTRWLSFQARRTPALIGEAMWSELHRPEALMPRQAEPEVEHPYYALGWVHETYRGHALVLHSGAVDGFTVHLGFLPETGQGLVILMNLDLATSALMTIAYSAYDRLLGLPPIDWEARLGGKPTHLKEVAQVALDFPIESVVGRYEHPAYGTLTVRVVGDGLVMEFRKLRLTLAYQGGRWFLSREPVVEGGPHIPVWFSEERLFVRMNFEEGDPGEVFTRADKPRPTTR
jgi:CubicO group peptidase (beta-lactamase class C family)